MEAPAYAALLGAMPVVALALLVFKSRLKVGSASWLVTALAAVLAVTLFGLDVRGLLYGAAKGGWTGVWILALVVPALLLYEIVDHGGALERLSQHLGALAPTPARQLLLVAWVFPSFLQGVAGFGVPIVVAAPMLVRLGHAPVAAVAACLVGYHWSVTFGSMGSSFFVAAGTAQLSDAATADFALKASVVLGISAAATGLLLLRRAEGARQAAPAALGIGAVMAATLVGVAVLQPALATTAAGLTGMLAAWVLLPDRGQRPALRPLLTAAAPYLLLTVLVAVAFGVPWVRDLAGQLPELAPSFAGSEAAFGHANEAVEAHRPLRPLLHPGPYLLVAAGFAALLLRRLGWWPGDGTFRAAVGSWARRSRSTTVSLLGLTVLSGVMIDAGMLSAVAGALARVFGVFYLPLAPVVGTVGTALTGSTTASNALLAPLQAEAARALDMRVVTLLTAQTAGGNLGNALTPINALIAAAAAGAQGREDQILRRSAIDVAPVGMLVIAAVVVLALLG